MSDTIPEQPQLITLEKDPGYRELQELVESTDLEIVPAFDTHNGRPCIVVVDEEGLHRKRPVNEEATKAYRAALDAQNMAYLTTWTRLVGHVVVIYTDGRGK